MNIYILYEGELFIVAKINLKIAIDVQYNELYIVACYLVLKLKRTAYEDIQLEYASC